MRRRGKGSKKEWTSKPVALRRKLLSKLLEYGRLSIIEFRSSAGVELRRRKYRDLEPPSILSPDVVDGRWHYIKLSSRVRLIGILDGHLFLAHAFDFDHDFE